MTLAANKLNIKFDLRKILRKINYFFHIYDFSISNNIRSRILFRSKKLFDFLILFSQKLYLIFLFTALTLVILIF